MPSEPERRAKYTDLWELVRAEAARTIREMYAESRGGSVGWTDADEGWLRATVGRIAPPNEKDPGRAVALALLRATERALTYLASEHSEEHADGHLRNWATVAAPLTLSALRPVTDARAVEVTRLVAIEMKGRTLGFGRHFTRRELACFAVLAGYEKGTWGHDAPANEARTVSSELEAIAKLISAEHTKQNAGRKVPIG